ncbi:mechanosensitive ion channel domain-containing protein [Lentilitoribacter sp. Alg239-R112]|uniref:mechanosensitive ion channel family protein n=1 Tax=Lentilitoribacter sp. Alg239-R112 TaxID=2305987 RepID=UPI0013A6B6AD|nr:mechanosensitive ion channel domain-containing protein [Lentilitoribacter sp. Alg239-R112]
MSNFLRFFIAMLFVNFSVLTVTSAQNISPSFERDQKQIESFETQIQILERRFTDNQENEDELIKLRTDTEDFLAPVLEMLDRLRAEGVKDKERLTALGDAPADGAEPEAEAITVERNKLTENSALLTVFIGKLDGVAAAGEDLIFDIGLLRRDMFTSQVFERVKIDTISFENITAAFSREFAVFKAKTFSWLSFVWQFKKQSVLISIALSILAGMAIFFGGYRYFGQFIHNESTRAELSFGSRLNSAFWSAIIPTLSVAAFGVSTYFLLLNFGVLRVDFASLFARVLQAIVLLVLVLKLASVILGPWAPRGRLLNLTDQSAKALYGLAVFTFLIQTVSYLGAGVRELLNLPIQSSVLQAFVETVLFALILIITSQLRPLVPKDESSGSHGEPWPLWVRLPMLMTGVGLIFSCLAGYVALGAFMSSQIIVTGAILIVVYFGLLSGKAIMQENAFAESLLGKHLITTFQFSQSLLNSLGLVTGIIINILLFGLGLSFVLLQWGYRPQELITGGLDLFTRIQIGGITISIVNIGIGLILFAIGYFATRRFQQWLDRNILSRGKVELGVRNSVRKVIGYFGIAVAAMIAVSAAGFDLSSLALVAGALSLGIGFGLQTIVSNFVSGLILLAERPFKAGDWVETTSVQGIVKEISVRATEIETFSRKSVIVPNSELVNGAVGNWTHRNSIGRVEVPIGVSYDNSPKKIMDLLLEIADENPNLLKIPEPSVEFVDFGASSLDFSLRGFLADISNGFNVRNELRVAIYDRLQAEGIEIPYPHREVYLHGPEESEN